MTSAQIFQLVVSLLTILGSVAGAVYGVKISVARVEEKVSAQGKELDEMRRRLERLETSHWFGKAGG